MEVDLLPQQLTLTDFQTFILKWTQPSLLQDPWSAKEEDKALDQEQLLAPLTLALETSNKKQTLAPWTGDRKASIQP